MCVFAEMWLRPVYAPAISHIFLLLSSCTFFSSSRAQRGFRATQSRIFLSFKLYIEISRQSKLVRLNLTWNNILLTDCEDVVIQVANNFYRSWNFTNLEKVIVYHSAWYLCPTQVSDVSSLQNRRSFSFQTKPKHPVKLMISRILLYSIAFFFWYFFCSIACAPHHCRHPPNSFPFDAFSIMYFYVSESSILLNAIASSCWPVCASRVCTIRTFVLFSSSSTPLLHSYIMHISSILHFRCTLNFLSSCFSRFWCFFSNTIVPFIQHLVRSFAVPYKRLKTLIFRSYTSKLYAHWATSPSIERRVAHTHHSQQPMRPVSQQA